MNQTKFLFLGMRGAFSLAALAALLRRGRRPAAVLVDRALPSSDPPQALEWMPPAGTNLPLRPSAARDSIVTLAQRRDIPAYDVGDPAAAAPLLRRWQPAFVVVACFPRLLPPLWWARQPCLNLHPSLLPAYRGPAPLFWQFRRGEPRMGITVHLLSAELDSGDIVAQAPLTFPDGTTTEEAERQAARRGIELLLESVSGEPLQRRAQNPQEATYFPAPTAEDRRLSRSWSVRRAYNFIRGARAWGPFRLDDGREVTDARVGEEGEVPAGWTPVRFADGILWLRLDRPRRFA